MLRFQGSCPAGERCFSFPGTNHSSRVPLAKTVEQLIFSERNWSSKRALEQLQVVLAREAQPGQRGALRLSLIDEDILASRAHIHHSKQKQQKQKKKKFYWSFGGFCI